MTNQNVINSGKNIKTKDTTSFKGKKKSTTPAVQFPVVSSDDTFLMRIKDEFIDQTLKTREIIKAIRDYLKLNDLYHTRITTEKELFGLVDIEDSEEKKKVYINTVGKYIFGVPGFPSRVRFVWDAEQKYVAYFKVPANIPEVAHKLLSIVADFIEDESNDETTSV